MTRPRVRLMRPTERGAVRNLGAPLFDHLGGYWDALDGWLRHPAVVTVVSHGGDGGQGGGLTGFALLGRLAAADVPTAYLLAIGVCARHRGLGLGRELLDAAIEQTNRRASRWGVSTLRLDVATDNSAARALFAGAGFVVLGPGEDYAAGQHSVRMELPVG